MKTRLPNLVAVPSVWAGQNQEEKGDLGELLKQRRDTLQELVQIVTQAYRQGTTLSFRC